MKYEISNRVGNLMVSVIAEETNDYGHYEQLYICILYILF